MNPVLIALALECAVADRLIGWGGWGRTGPVVGAVVSLLVTGVFLHLTPAGVVTMPLAFLAWRTPGWGVVPGGTINPVNAEQFFGTFFRHGMALAFLLPAWLSHLALGPVALCLVGFAFASAVLGVINAVTLTVFNWAVETFRGLLLGVALGAGFVLLQ